MGTKRNRKFLVGAAAIALVVASAAWGNFDSPDGEPPFGIDFTGATGQSYEGVVTVLLTGYDDLTLTASGFNAVVRLRRGGELHVFHVPYACSSDSCDLCLNGRIDVTQIAPIQLCIQDEIAPEVVTDFGLTSATVKLKNMSSFVSELDPSDATVRVVGADIDVKVR